MKQRWWMPAAVAWVMLISGCATTYERPYPRDYAEAPPPGPGATVSVSYFYDDLAPYGRWVEYRPYGWCWTPYDVGPDWRPYSDGYWAYTDFGWTWMSSEPWGWAAYHYGRWAFDRDYGWVWVPGTTWGPAWVAWHSSDDWVGWAPLPPAAGWDASIGLSFGDVDRIPSSYWCFVERRHLVDRNVRPQMVSVARNRTLLERTIDVTRFEARDGRPINRGLKLEDVERMTGRPIQQVRVVDVDSPDRARAPHVGGGAIGLFRPSVRDADPQQAPPPEVTREEIERPTPELERRQEWEKRKLEQSLASERQRLDREQAKELRSQGPLSRTIEEVRARQAAEKQAFDEHAAEQRQVLEQRHRKRIARPERANDMGKSRDHRKDKDKDKDKKEHGEG